MTHRSLTTPPSSGDPALAPLEKQFTGWRFWRTAAEIRGEEWVIHATRNELPTHQRRAGLLAKLTANSVREMAEYVHEQDTLAATLTPEPVSHGQAS